MKPPMQVDLYLERIGYRGPVESSPHALGLLHAAHLYAVPFENLDVHLSRPIVLSLPALFEKIVRRRRGGFCYELNALFGWLLREIGFPVQMLSARVYDGSAPGPEFDHMVLLVEAGGPYIADVGFGDSFTEPLPLRSGAVHLQNGSGYRLTQVSEDWVLERERPGASWEPQYAFSLQPRRLDDFRDMCQFHQTSPASSFTRKSVCSLASKDGRVTLSNSLLILTTSGGRQERAIASPEAYLDVLRALFGIDLAEDAHAASTLMALGQPADRSASAGEGADPPRQ